MGKNEELLALFQANLDMEKLEKIAAWPALKKKYIIAFTPRSGSSYLCDVLGRTKTLGRPGEMLSRQFLPNLLKNAPGRNPDEYLENILKVTRSPNVSGIKASWFQFNDFLQVMENQAAFNDFRFIYLTRRELPQQAVSLYRATETDVFHTNIQHDAQKLAKLGRLGYDYEKIDYWYKHIAVQEAGWSRYFALNNIYPLCITYEEIDADVVAVVRRIAGYLGMPAAAKSASADSIFKKIGERKNLRWSCKYQLDKDDLQRAKVAEPPLKEKSSEAN